MAECRRKEQFPSPLSLPCLHYAGKVSTASGTTFEIAAEVWHYGQWLEEGLKEEKKKRRKKE